jgi:glycine cleavage system H protein
MHTGKPDSLYYKRSHFTTHLPVGHLYTPSHCWLKEIEPGLWRVGLTRFATRMLGETVDFGFEAGDGLDVIPGQIVGWIEGFKAISDLYCVAAGKFQSSNPILKTNIALINKDCYGEGWLYMVRGKPDPKCCSVEEYRTLLDSTIDRILEKQKNEEIK